MIMKLFGDHSNQGTSPLIAQFGQEARSKKSPGSSNLLLLKGHSTQKYKFCHHLLTLKLLQTCVSFFLLLNRTQRKIFWRTIGTLAPLTSCAQ